MELSPHLQAIGSELELIAQFRRENGELSEQLVRLEFLQQDFLRLDQKELEASRQLEHLVNLKERFLLSPALRKHLLSTAPLKIEAGLLDCL